MTAPHFIGFEPQIDADGYPRCHVQCPARIQDAQYSKCSKLTVGIERVRIGGVCRPAVREYWERLRQRGDEEK